MTKNDKHCDKCFFYRKLTSGEQRYCSYLFVTGHMRPCPPGKGCTVKIPMKVKRKKKARAKKNEVGAD